MSLKYATRDGIGSSLQLALGRRNLYRLARILMRRARRDTTNNHGDRNGEFELQDAVLRSSEAPVVFDIGANIGDWSARLLNAFPEPKIRVHAFEPCSGTVADLQRRIKDPRLVVLQAACSDTRGTAALNLVEAGCGRNSLVPGLPDQGGTEIVQLTTIDDYCRENSISHIDLIKIDAEGHDLSVMKGAQRTLKAKAVPVLQFEYNQRWVFSRTYLRDAFELLSGLGYSIGKLSKGGVEFYGQWDWQLEDFCENNFVACLPSARKLLRGVNAEWLVPGG